MSFQRLLLTTFGTLWLGSALATGIDNDDVASGTMALSIKGWLTYGTAIRTSRPDPELISTTNGQAVGVAGKALNGQNQDDGNLNFKRGDRISTVLKGVAEIEAKGTEGGALLRIKAWQDSALQNDPRPWGNIPNNYAANQPLSDRGFAKLAQFSGIQPLDAYVYGRYAPGGQALQLRLGYQSIDWSTQTSIGGGLAIINPVDLPATYRPGALAMETKVPIPALAGQLTVSDTLRLEGFYQFKWRPNAINGCGTFFATADYMADGCDKISIGLPLPDRNRLAAGSYIQRSVSPTVNDAGEFGIGAVHRVHADAEINTEYGVYFARYHSRTGLASAIKSTRPSTPFLLGNSDGQNLGYFIEYPEGIRMLAVSFKHSQPDLTLFGEINYRPDQPVQLNSMDLLNAFASTTAASLLRTDANATAPGGNYHGYDRLKVINAMFGIQQRRGGVWGAESLNLTAEIGLKQMLNLPEVTSRRYGRLDLSGIGPINGQCPAGASDKQCSNDGYVTPSSWGYRLRASWRYPAAIAGVDLTPSLSFSHDVRGWSYDNVFNAGRQTLVAGLRGEYQKRYQVDLSYAATAGGWFNNTKDRDYLALSAGIAF